MARLVPGASQQRRKARSVIAGQMITYGREFAMEFVNKQGT
jgi:hypothetical protein